MTFTFNLYAGHELVAEQVSFNTALGRLYRSQGFGAPSRPGYVNAFDLRAALHGGFARVGRLVAIANVDLYVVRNGYGAALSRPLPRITAEQFLAEIDYAAPGHQTSPACYIEPLMR